MKLASLVLAGAVLTAVSPAFAGSHSDFTKSFPLQTLQTFQFKDQDRISRDPLANNSIWAANIKDEIRSNLISHGLAEASHGQPADFYVTYYIGLKERDNINAAPYGLSVIHGYRGGWLGGPRAYAVWTVPYTESTLMVDVIDAHSNQLVWRGYDSDTLNADKPDKTLDKAVDNVMSRFFHDVKEHRG